jgi:hypothetical protein
MTGTVTPGPFGIIHIDRTDPAARTPARSEPDLAGVGHARCARLWNPVAMHLLPADRSDHRVIDAERICPAVAVLDGTPVTALLAGR